MCVCLSGHMYLSVWHVCNTAPQRPIHIPPNNLSREIERERERERESVSVLVGGEERKKDKKETKRKQKRKSKAELKRN